MKKRLTGALALIAAVAVLGGCGRGNNSDTGAGRYVKLPEYKGVEVNVPSADRLLEINTLQTYFDNVLTPTLITDRAVQLCDLANIDFEGKRDGVAFDGGTSEGYSLLIGSGQFIEGFEEGLIGVMPGETVDLNLRFPDGYGNAELAGQEVVFTVKVNGVSVMEDNNIPSLNIEGVSTVEQFRQYERENLMEEIEAEYQARVGSAAMEKVMAEAVFEELPAEMLTKNRQLYEEWIGQSAQSYGMDAKTFLQIQGLDYESTLTQYAEEYTRQQLLLRAIADEEGLNLSDKALKERMNEYAESIDMELSAIFDSGFTEDDFRDSFLYEDVMTILIDNAVNTWTE